MVIADKKSLNALIFMATALVSAAGALGCGSGGSAVSGTLLDTYAWEGGEATVPRSPEGTAVAAIAIDADGDSEEFEGELHGDGSFDIPGVPEGGYYLRLSALDASGDSGFRGTFYWTSERALELGVTVPERPDAIQSTSSSTEITFDIAGLNPWQSDDGVWFYATGAYLSSRLSDQTLLEEGTTELGSVKLGADVLVGANLIDGSKGDRAYITQLTSRGTESFRYSSVAKALKAEPFTMTDGGAAAVSGSLEDVPQQTISIDWKQSRFEDAANTPALSGFVSLIIQHALHRSRLLEALNMPQVVAADVTFGNPYPSEWELYAFLDAQFTSDEPGDSRRIIFRCATPISGAGPLVLAPEVSTVTNITLNKTGSSPILSWTAPSADGPVHYRISVQRDDMTVALIYTSETSAAIPDILAPSAPEYEFRVRAIRGALDLTTRGVSSPTCYAEAPSDRFSL